MHTYFSQINRLHFRHFRPELMFTHNLQRSISQFVSRDRIVQSARAFRALRFRILERLFRIDSQKNEHLAFLGCPKAIRVMKEYKKILERSPNDRTVSLVKNQYSHVRDRIESLRNIGRIKFFLLRDSIEFPVTVGNNIDGKFDITKIRYDKFNFKVRRRVGVVKWFRCSYSSGYSESGSFETLAGFGKNRRDGMGKSKRRRRRRRWRRRRRR